MSEVLEAWLCEILQPSSFVLTTLFLFFLSNIRVPQAMFLLDEKFFRQKLVFFWVEKKAKKWKRNDTRSSHLLGSYCFLPLLFIFTGWVGERRKFFPLVLFGLSTSVRPNHTVLLLGKNVRFLYQNLPSIISVKFFFDPLHNFFFFFLCNSVFYEQRSSTNAFWQRS